MYSRWLSSLGLAVLLTLGACDSPVGWSDRPEQNPGAGQLGTMPDPSQRPTEQEPDLRYLAQYRAAPRPEQVLGFIGPEGGSLRAGDFEVVVPAGAVARSTLFRIRIPAETGNAQHAYAEFEANSAFLLPVTIRLPLDATNAQPGAEILWWATDHWVPLTTTPTADGRIEAQTSHFSIYGTSLFKGITTVGG